MKIRNRLCSVAIIIVVLISEICFASDGRDFEYWSSVGVCFDINKDWEFTFEEEFKVGDDAGRLYCHNSDFGFVYRSLADWLDLGFNFKMEYEKDSGGRWRQENRPHLNLKLKGKPFGLDVSDRSRLEYRNRENEKDIWRYRNKITVKLPLKLTELGLQPYIAEEVFINGNAEDFNKNRLYSGLCWHVSKNIKVDVFYLWQSSKSDGSWCDTNDTNVLGTGLEFHF